MQKIIFIHCLLFLLSSFVLGCQTVQRVPQVGVLTEPELAAPENTVSSTLAPTPTMTLEMTPRSIATPLSSEVDFHQLVCDLLVCQTPWEGLLARPIGPQNQDRIDRIYPYGSTRAGTLDPHHGVEFYNSSGTPVYAAESGLVVYAGTDEQTRLGPYTHFYGNVIILQHPDLFGDEDLFTLYAHLSEIFVSEGEQVSRGNQLGLVGSTGAADGSHLHFEVRLGINDYQHTTNPALWLAPKGRESLLAGLILDRWANPLQDVAFSLELLTAEGSVDQRFYPQTYHPSLNTIPELEENFVAFDLPPGEYRLAFVAGTLHEYFFELEPGSLAFIKVQLD